MDRRAFLKTLSAGAVTLALDPDLKLWVPGQKSIFIPNRTIYEATTVIWKHPLTGSVAVPMESDATMDRYRNAGYVRVELSTLDDLGAFCKQHRMNHDLLHENQSYVTAKPVVEREQYATFPFSRGDKWM